ncbi:Rop guanine nucleotide exchange factor 13 [Porphyridium purpureum]|uniref:Rop guanine nucleotide exchange factor 13 n=1 Tax=Porphyridium purpureum TaxID=35688 RepID=A0A5J4YPP3_PORPP|nr:Rop guanine nucleotide exchange factor 13 [Porphyridium purpureum]|eukprot:POR2182..scf296_7
MMPIPSSFVGKLPASGHEILGDDLVAMMSRNTAFDIKSYLVQRGQWNERDAGFLASNLEKAILSWEMRLETEKSASSKRKLDLNFSRRNKLKNMHLVLAKARIALKHLREAFPFMAPTALQMAKVCANLDAGKAGLEAYSRALEGRAGVIKERLLQIISADIDEGNRKPNSSKR